MSETYAIFASSLAALQVLCFYGLNSSLLATTGNLYLAAGKPEVRTKLNLLQLVLMALLMYPLTIRYGIMGAAVAAMVPSALVVVGGAVYAGYLWWRNREIFYEVKGLVGRR
jgi:O-antigen/teichoic acid export membrane protein